MPVSVIQCGFAAGEISPSLRGRVDLNKYHQAAFTMRNTFVNYRGGASSRAGTAYVGMCKQSGSAAPPRDIPFQFSLTQGYALEFGEKYMRVKSNGAYVVEAAKAVASVDATGLFTTGSAHSYSIGDWVFDQGNVGFSGLTWIISSVPTSTTFTVTDLFGVPVTSATASTTGTVARIYTVATPYAAVDLPYLKYTQSADTMTLCCVNTATLTEYPSYELVRHGITNWTLTQDTFTAAISPPAGLLATAQNSTTPTTWYSYVVTAVDENTGEESIASPAANVLNNDIAVNAGSNRLVWDTVPSAGTYNVYKATPSYNLGVPVGVAYGYIGSSFGPAFVDTNITADFTRVPPTHNNPFARGAIENVIVAAGGTGYTQATVGYVVNTGTGSGFVGIPVILSGGLVGFIVQDTGQGYLPGDTISITDSGGGTGAAVTLVIGPQSGTYPSVAAYFQQRRVYGGSLNQPDTLWFSQPGSFSNMDSSIPTTDGDAITATPWAQQVDGVQFLVSMPGGLLSLTGKGAWQVNGGNSSGLTPSDITANPQAYNGCNNIVPPVVVNYDVLYLQAKGSIFRDLAYNFFTNIYTGTDITILSNQMFAGYTFSQWCWAEEPYKLAWAVRSDGALLSLTFLKEQEVEAWAKHDTAGQFVGVCSITEPPVDAVYLIVKRFIRGQWVYYSERMDNRTDWSTPENCWCVDAGIAYPLTYPNATLTPAAADGTDNITGVDLIIGGTSYTSPVVTAIDPTGAGTGATFAATVSGGVITAISIVTQGQNYAPGTTLMISDATGSGAVAQPIITNNVVFNASSPVFNTGMIGNVIRVGGGMATIIGVPSGGQALANITQPIVAVTPNDPNQTPIPQAAGTWSVSAPVTTVSGLNHLEGQTVAIVADGSVVTPQVVSGGSITLPQPASCILVGLPFTAQLQTPYLEPPGGMTIQGKRKNIYSVTVRSEASRGLQVGTNQVDASTLPGGYPVTWTGMKEIKERTAAISAGSAIPLFTGDSFINVPADWNTAGQVAVQQIYPMPMNVLAICTAFHSGDDNG